MKLYIDLTTTRSYEVEVKEPAVWEALAVQQITARPHEGLADVLAHVSGTYPGELALAALVGNLEPVDESESWTLETWDSDVD